MSVVDSSAWLRYSADGSEAPFFCIERYGKLGGQDRSADLDRAHRQRLGLQRQEIQSLRCMVNVEAEHVAGRIEVDVEAIRNLACLRSRPGLELDMETVRLGIVVKLHG